MSSRIVTRRATAACIAMVLTTSAFVDARAESSLKKVTAANAEIIADIQAAEAANGTPPRMSDPVYTAKFRMAFDVDALDQMRDDDLDGSLNVCDSVAKTLMSYAMFGAKQAGIETGDTQAAAAQLVELENRNSITYEDEISSALHFSIKCAAGEIRAVTKLVASQHLTMADPVRKAGLARARHGIIEIYIGAITGQIEGYTRAHKQVVLDDLVAFRNTFAEAMQDADRQQVLSAIDEVLTSSALDAGARPKLELIKEAMKVAPCSALCQI